MADRPAAVFAMDPVNVSRLFPPPLMERLTALLDLGEPGNPRVLSGFTSDAERAALSGVEVLITGWGCPPLDEQVMAAAPRLRIVLHAAGTVRKLVTDACWDRGVVVSTAAEANARPVAEYTLAAALLAGKDAFRRSRLSAHQGGQRSAQESALGNNGRRLGIIGASRVGRALIELLRPFRFAVSLSDPYVEETEAVRLGVTLLPLDDLLRSSDIVTLHAPDIPQTYRLLDRRRLALIPDGATLINTSRGALIAPDALTDELVSGRLRAVLDVTEPEPLPASSPLHGLPNVLLTPHIAGSLGNELEQLGRSVLDEAERVAEGLPLRHEVRRTDLSRVA
ncbi:hydroxyacid dehydrogenase [Streptacidiphilus fuscans]|uniref:Hydroxyacid dehydrogenase n=1 Tax=Streptacidiphilus fuscans TaxID=2789292 RepID=A0A931B2G8_9ACTN|nr:hydroxyacid dehydrogenase [Streptacidiphilus fuscans]MBF9069159.1 hydroxyacid dehydrogenase [Streptacidiphilus fuscans]